MKIAIIGGGEVGRAYAEALATRSGHTPILCTPRPKPEALQLAEAHGIDIVTEAGTWLGDVDRVWICVTGDIASSVCRELLEHLKPGVVLIDLTTATPEDKRRSFAAAAERGVEYVDAVILGAVALTKAQTPLLAAGLSAQAFMSEFVELGAPLRVLPRAHAGDAAALKLLRTILTKGLESLAVNHTLDQLVNGLRLVARRWIGLVQLKG